jgi:hypothetical protein
MTGTEQSTSTRDQNQTAPVPQWGGGRGGGGGGEEEETSKEPEGS